MVARLEPRIIEMLGTRWTRHYELQIDPDFDQFDGDTRTWDRRVRMGIKSLTEEKFEPVLCHELVHVHMTGHWRELPQILQEGVATWVTLSVLGFTGKFRGPPPEPAWVVDVLTLPYRAYKYAEPERQNVLKYAATWLAVRMFPPQPSAGGEVEWTTP